MLRSFLASLAFLILALPTFSFASDELTILESVVAAGERGQPGLQNYLATIETTRIEELLAGLTQGSAPDGKPPAPPVINKFWQRKGKGLVYVSNTQLSPAVAEQVQQISADLAVDLNDILLPAEQAGQRRALVKGAKITLSDVALADRLIHHLEITFAQPTDLGQAFYTDGIRLPQKQITALVFDIDSTTETVSELHIVADDGMQLTVEIRYIEVPGGYVPERIKVTSPDGKIDDLFETVFSDVDGYLLPSSTQRTIRRPDLMDNTQVIFKNYRVNQQIPADLQDRLDNK